jgi:hypothetical protein
MPHLLHHLRLVVLIGSCALATACSSTANVRSIHVASAPPASPTKLAVSVDQSKNNDRGEALALQNGLLREFRSAGYEAGEGGLSVTAQIKEVDRGSTLANVAVGMGAGNDHVDVDVQVSDHDGKQLMAFTVRGTAVDKRYRNLTDVLNEDLPRKIRKEIQSASR